MVSTSLILYCLVAAGVYLLAISVVLGLVGKALRLSRYVPPGLLEEQGLSWRLIDFMMDFLFYAAIPSFAYSLFYLLLPLSGVRIGMAVALLAFTLGMVPTVMGLSVRVKLPMPYLLFYLLEMLLKLGGSMIVIGYLYSL
jgi:hypothetical protein